MPNWTSNDLYIENAPADLTLDEVNRRFCTRIEGELRIDFNTIIPMPETMMVTSGALEHDRLRLYCLLNGLDIPEYPSRRNYLSGHWRFETKKDGTLYSAEDYRELFGDEYASAVEEGRKIYQNVTQYGYMDWYSWSNDNWGTKWNACDAAAFQETGDHTFACYFSTAWSAPFPIAKRLSEIFPTARIWMNSDYEEGFEIRTEYQNGAETFSTARIWMNSDYEEGFEIRTEYQNGAETFSEQIEHDENEPDDDEAY